MTESTIDGHVGDTETFMAPGAMLSTVLSWVEREGMNRELSCNASPTGMLDVVDDQIRRQQPEVSGLYSPLGMGLSRHWRLRVGFSNRDIRFK